MKPMCRSILRIELSNKGMEYLVLALMIAAVLAGLFFLVTYICFRRTFVVDKSACSDPYAPIQGEQYDKFNKDIPRLVDGVVNIEYESVYTVSSDGTKLFGRFYNFKEGAPVQILLHGYKGNAYREFCGGLKLARELGCNALLVDERAHGKSEGKALSFGVKEREDVLSWIELIREKCGNDIPIALVGISMGAATVLMASELTLPDNVKCIIADCPYSSPRAIIAKVIGEMGLPVKVSVALVRMGGIIYGGFDINSCSAVGAMKANKLPVLIIHGEDDRFVPDNMSREIYDACTAEKRLFTVKDAGHGLCYMIDAEGYHREVAQFVEKYLIERESCAIA